MIPQIARNGGLLRRGARSGEPMSRCVLFALVLVFGLYGCPSPSPVPATDAGAPSRLRIVNGSTEPMWIFWLGAEAGGTLPDAHQILLAPGDHHDYAIPAGGLAGTRFWPGLGCDDTGNGCEIGQSGGPSADGFTCPSEGCAPPIDSKFEGTFGCLPGVLAETCQVNPSSPTMARLPATDSWDTSLVDGFTLPFAVRVIGDCPSGPMGGAIDCSALALSACPTSEDLSSGGVYPDLANLSLVAGGAGCYSDCGRLTFSQRGNAPTFAPTAEQAQDYCCPTPPVSPEECRAGPVASTGYTDVVHRLCPQVYAYGYDDGVGLWSCPAGVRYEVTFYGRTP